MTFNAGLGCAISTNPSIYACPVKNFTIASEWDFIVFSSNGWPVTSFCSLGRIKRICSALEKRKYV